MSRITGYDGAINVLEQGRTLTVISETVSGSAITSKTIATICDGATISLFVSSIVGNLTIRVLTETADGKDYELFSFPVVTEASTALTLKTAAPTMGIIRVEAIYNGNVTYEVHARGLSSGEVSARVVSPVSARTGKAIINTMPSVLLSSTNTNRSAILLRNMSGIGTVFIGFTLAQTTYGSGFPVYPGESFMLNIAGGQTVYAIGTTADLDVRYVEASDA